MYETIIKIVENLVLPQHLYIESKNMNYYQSPMNFFINHEIHERTRKHSSGGFANPPELILEGE